MVPEVGSSNVINKRMRVVFPDPLGPMTATFSEGIISKFIPFRTSRSTKDLCISSYLTIGLSTHSSPFLSPYIIHYISRSFPQDIYFLFHIFCPFFLQAY